jgi:RNA polymerase sigma-70 factor (ECF subfamily)
MSSEREGTGHADAISIENIDGLYSYAYTLTRNHAEAEDLVQETYLRAIRASGRLRPDSNMKAWLFTILRNVWFNQLRQWRKAPDIVELEPDGTGPIGVADTAKGPHAIYMSNIEQEQVRAAIQQLSTEFREIIILREYEELSYQEIAAILECPQGTVMSRLARARSKLRDLLSPTSVRRDWTANPQRRQAIRNMRSEQGDGSTSSSPGMNRRSALRLRGIDLSF